MRVLHAPYSHTISYLALAGSPITFRRPELAHYQVKNAGFRADGAINYLSEVNC